jgi:hypothetical protein
MKCLLAGPWEWKWQVCPEEFMLHLSGLKMAADKHATFESNGRVRLLIFREPTLRIDDPILFVRLTTDSAMTVGARYVLRLGWPRGKVSRLFFVYKNIFGSLRYGLVLMWEGTYVRRAKDLWLHFRHWQIACL